LLDEKKKPTSLLTMEWPEHSDISNRTHAAIGGFGAVPEKGVVGDTGAQRGGRARGKEGAQGFGGSKFSQELKGN